MGGSTLELYNDWTARSDRAHLVRYEDSIVSPSETLTALLEYLEVDSSPAIVQHMLEAAGEGTPRHFPQHQTSGSPEQSIGRWRRDLDASLQAVCEEDREYPRRRRGNANHSAALLRFLFLAQL